MFTPHPQQPQFLTLQAMNAGRAILGAVLTTVVKGSANHSLTYGANADPTQSNN